MLHSNTLVLASKWESMFILSPMAERIGAVGEPMTPTLVSPAPFLGGLTILHTRCVSGFHFVYIAQYQFGKRFKMAIKSVRNVEDAETLALRVLEFVLANEILQKRFLAISGMMPEGLKEAVHDRVFLGGVLDFILGNEADLYRFCDEYQVELTEPMQARRQLPGYTPND